MLAALRGLAELLFVPGNCAGNRHKSIWRMLLRMNGWDRWCRQSSWIIYQMKVEMSSQQMTPSRNVWHFSIAFALIFLSPFGYPLVLALFHSFRFRLSRNNKARGRSLVVCDWELNDKSIRFTDDYRPSTFCLLATWLHLSCSTLPPNTALSSNTYSRFSLRA